MAEFPRDDRQNLSPATSMLYDLLSVWPDPTARIRSRGYIICNDPYIRCSRLVFSSLKLGRKSHSYSTTITRIEKDRWKVKIRYRWRREREGERGAGWGRERERKREEEIEKSYVLVWPQYLAGNDSYPRDHWTGSFCGFREIPRTSVHSFSLIRHLGRSWPTFCY